MYHIVRTLPSVGAIKIHMRKVPHHRPLGDALHRVDALTHDIAAYCSGTAGARKPLRSLPFCLITQGLVASWVRGPGLHCT
jgi:hypothetical protein